MTFATLFSLAACGKGSPDTSGGREGLGGPVAIIQAEAATAPRPTHGFLGIVWVPGDTLTVATVAVDSSVSAGGLTAGDVVTAIDGDRVSTPTEVTELLKSKRSGESVRLEFTRGREKRSLVAELMRYEELVARLRTPHPSR